MSGKDRERGAPKVAVHAEAVEDLLARLSVDPKGLSDAEAKKRLEKHGRNELPAPPKPSPIKQFFAQFANPIVGTLLVAAVIAIYDGYTHAEKDVLERYGDATAILLIVGLNAFLGFYQERRAEAALDALQKMQTPNARVRRGGKVTTISAAEVVVGDVLELEAGDAIPADARLLQTANVTVEEASLTGESVPVVKEANAIVADDATLGDRSNMVFLGTSLTKGTARAVVVCIAAATEVGKLNTLLQSVEMEKTPLEEKIDAFGKKILWACLGLSVLLFVRGILKGDQPWNALLLTAVSLAVAAIPEGLPAITTITLALGMQRMAKRGALIRKLAAVETLGSANVICSDKTGTLTQNEMTVREVWAGGIDYTVTGVGYDAKGDVVDPDGNPVTDPKGPLRDLLATVALCNNATLEPDDDGNWKVIGDPTEGALLTLAAKGGVPRESFGPEVKVVKELPFDSDRKRMTVVALDEHGREIVHAKGSADVLIKLCTSYATPSGIVDLDDPKREELLAIAEEMAKKALRVLGVARRILREAPKSNDPPDVQGQEEQRNIELEERLTFVGLVGMIDPPREGVKEAVRLCNDAGVRAVMITGDHKLTAIAIARELGLWDDRATAWNGAELEKMSDYELEARVDQARVFARVTAEQKLRIVRAFKARGNVVAMTGDGVNDAPALREAHIGVAMGKNGTDVARQAADMVLADDNFATIVDAVREGRAIYRNIQKFIYFLLSSNAGLLVTVFVGSFVPQIKALTPLMLLWINLVTNGLPALALGIDPPDPTQMAEPPRKSGDGLLTGREYLGIAVVGIWMGFTALACYQWPWPHEEDGASQSRAIAFSLLALSPLFHSFNCRSSTTSIVSLRPLVSKALLLAVVVSTAIHFVVFIPSLRKVFHTFQLSGYEWGVLLALSFSIVPAIELLKLLQRSGAIGGDLGPLSRRVR